MERAHAYEQLYALLKERIVRGAYAAGTCLPSEHTLRQAHGLNRATVRRALERLCADGLIDKQQGRGSVVIYRPQALDLLSFRGFTEVIAGTPHRADSHLLRPPYQSDWPEGFFYPLADAEAAGGCYRLDRLRRVDGRPVMLEHTFLPRHPKSDGVAAAFAGGSLFHTLHADGGIEITGVDQHLRAVGAGTAAAAHLAVVPGAPILHIVRRYATNVPSFYVYSTLLCNTETYALGGTFS
ncbi:MAG: GntR family transcriptional regulator [Catalinimonas sp.]